MLGLSGYFVREEYVDGIFPTASDIRGVTLFGIQDDRIVSGRLCMEEVEESGANIDEAVRRLAEEARLESD